MKVCLGCGAPLQSSDPKTAGYTPKEDSLYCRRCFRLIHYDDPVVSMRTGIDPDQIFAGIESMDALMVWTADLFDFESSMIAGLQRKTGGKDIVMVATKRDLLPRTVSHEKLAQFIFSRTSEYGISLKELVLTSEKDPESIEAVRAAVRKHSSGRKVVMAGRANTGKSTILNRLAGQRLLTSSRYPGTTLAFHTIEIDGMEFVDTPGIEIEHSVLMAVDESDLKTILPASEIKPQIFQIHGRQTFSAGGLARFDIRAGEKATAVFYLSDRLNLHRGKTENADNLWKEHYGTLLKPIPLENRFRQVSGSITGEKEDIVVDGLGWLCVSGDVSSVTVHVPEQVNVSFRKAML